MFLNRIITRLILNEEPRKRNILKNVTDIQILHVSFAAVDKKVTALVAWLVTKCLFRIFDGKLTEQKLILKDVLKEMSFYNQHFEGTFKGELFKDLMEVVRSKIRGS